MQGLPGSYCGWLLLDALMAALADADSVAGAVHAMRALPPLVLCRPCCPRSMALSSAPVLLEEQGWARAH